MITRIMSSEIATPIGNFQKSTTPLKTLRTNQNKSNRSIVLDDNISNMENSNQLQTNREDAVETTLEITSPVHISENSEVVYAEHEGNINLCNSLDPGQNDLNKNQYQPDVRNNILNSAMEYNNFNNFVINH